MKVTDFRNLKRGTLVKRSAHYFKSRGSKKADHYDRNQIGIVVDLTFFPDAVAGVICFPVIQWEGAVSSSMTHPANAVPYRKSVKGQMVEVAG